MTIPVEWDRWLDPFIGKPDILISENLKSEISDTTVIKVEPSSSQTLTGKGGAKNEVKMEK